MADKIYNLLPVVLQTPAIKNFFEYTVEQLYSRSQTTPLSGYIGKKGGEDVDLLGAFLETINVDRYHYSLSPAVNDINPVTGESENLIFYDELVDILEVYGVNVRNHNTLFASNFQTFMPPINIDKFVNYAEYFWSLNGPRTIVINIENIENALNLEKDFLGQKNYDFVSGTVYFNSVDPDTGRVIVEEIDTGRVITGRNSAGELFIRNDDGTTTTEIGRTRIRLVPYTGLDGKSLRNGMIIRFVGDGVSPGQSSTSSFKASNNEVWEDINNVEYIVGGVGESIYLTRKSTNTQTAYGGSNQDRADYLVVERNSIVGSAWSRVNHWHHRDNFLNVGEALPEKKHRARRPIIEFENNIEMYQHGVRYRGEVDLYSNDISPETNNAEETQRLINVAGLEARIDGVVLSVGMVIAFPEERYLYRVSIITEVDTTDDDNNANDGLVVGLDRYGDILEIGDTINVRMGNIWAGHDFYFTQERIFREAQRKTKENQAPLFMLYDDNKNALNGNAYRNSDFSGSRVFGYADGIGNDDRVLGFPLAYSQFKNSSEISFENYIQTEVFKYNERFERDILGTFYYKIVGERDEYCSCWKPVTEKSEQKILTTYEFDSIAVENEVLSYEVGAIPNEKPGTPTGYDIIARRNGDTLDDYRYSDGEILFSQFIFTVGDILEIEVSSDTGINFISDGRYDFPLSWRNNPNNGEIEIVAEPHYIDHFKMFIESQDGFSGDPLASNNFDNLEKNLKYATDIVQTDENLTLAAFLLDDQPHNLVDALRFCGREYEKYKNRLVMEATNYSNLVDIRNLTNEEILEQSLRRLVSHSPGKDVFGSTYILPFGDIYDTEEFEISDITSDTFILTEMEDITNLQNTVLVYHNSIRQGELKLLLLDRDYVIVNTDPITFELRIEVETGDVIVTKMYNSVRDSAECPPTPSSMGIYPLYQPRIETDTSFQEPISVVVGHDGSRTPVVDSFIDDILLEFETRIYNSCQKQFRDANSLPRMNKLQIRPGFFRNNGVRDNGYNDLLRQSFVNWSRFNKTDYRINEFYDESDDWTWNFRGNENIPGNWRGWYEFYYDTVRPNTHPWEMLGFFEKPAWWDSQYGTNYSSLNENMWNDLELGIIRQGTRENYRNGDYLQENEHARSGLSNLLPVDRNGELISPNNIVSTGTTTFRRVENWENTRHTTTPNIVADKFVLTNGINISYGENHVFIRNDNINKNFSLPNHSDIMAVSVSAMIPANHTDRTHLNDNIVGITVTGVPILNPKKEVSYNNEGIWHENAVYRNEIPENGTYVIRPEHAGLSEWDKTVHSPIVGWAFDGLPIYGPYGYERYNSSNEPVDPSVIVPIQSSFRIKSGDSKRNSNPFGGHTGEYVEDYEFSQLDDLSDRPDRYNIRYGTTPDSPNRAIYFYVATVDEDGEPMFPYVFGGLYEGEAGIAPRTTITWRGRYAFSTSASNNLANNNDGTVEITGETNAITSVLDITTQTSNTDLISAEWTFGDGAPVENAWKYGSSYPFAVTEAMLLGKPGRFATFFSDPTAVLVPETERHRVISNVDRSVWDYRSAEHFRIHGDVINNNEIVNSGYTQFIHSWLVYQGLNTKTDFVDKLRNVNTKLAHRMEGFIDKDTLKIRSDQFSGTGSTDSLLIPEENIEIVVHSSPYKNRNFYSGVIVHKVEGGYKVRGYDRNLGYFNTLRPNRNGPTNSVEVGGEPVGFVIWEPNTQYVTGTIVSYRDRYYEAPTLVMASPVFQNNEWRALPSLPQRGAVRGILYQESLAIVDRVDYDTLMTSVQEVFEFLVALGNYQEAIGFDFGEFDVSINERRDWSHSATQFLFWVAGGWENNNTIDLSPMATKISFNSLTGAVAKLNRIERGQFNLVDQSGRAIQPTECEIIRLDNTIEIIPPEGIQIYGCLLYTRETEHAIAIDNITAFNDTIYNPLLNQKQTRLRVRGNKTDNWDGRFVSQGFIIDGDELKPNLDNMAESLGRYHELGFVPVEKQLYEQARGLFGYQERSYLSDLELDDDTQYEFYSGMIREKGTTPALSKIAKSSNIVQGTIEVFDEWAVKVGEFGDLENNQAIEVKLEREDLVHDPQLITLAFPEDTTGVVDRIEVVRNQHRYYTPPQIEIEEPPAGQQATAEARLDENGEISEIIVTDKGSGYQESTTLNIIASDIVVENLDHIFRTSLAQSSALLPADTVASLSLDSFSISDHRNTNDVVVSITNLGIETTLADVARRINDLTSVAVNAEGQTSDVRATASDFFTLDENNMEVHRGVLSIQGSDFTLGEMGGTTLANLNIAVGRYQPRQRFNVASFDAISATEGAATTAADIAVYVNDVEVPSSNWTYQHGSRGNFTFDVSSVPLSQRIDPNTNEEFTYAYTGNVSFVIDDEDDIIPLDNLVSDGNIYRHISVFVNGIELINTAQTRVFGITRETDTDDMGETTTTTTLTIYDVGSLPEGRIEDGTIIHVHEHSTIEFGDSYKGDIPEARLRIRVTANDIITSLVKSERIYEITPDIKNDDTILIDIDDSERFLKKPMGVRDSGLWPVTDKVSYLGVLEEKFREVPNAGYVNKNNVDFRAFRVEDVRELFLDTIFEHPKEGSILHIAKSENNDWNVYKLKEAETSVSYVEMLEGYETSYLYSNVDLFDFVDNNSITTQDTARFLDYHVVIKNTEQNEKFCIWTNQETISSEQVRICDLDEIVMTEANVISIGPTTGSAVPISNISPAVGRIYPASARIAGNNVVRISTNTDGLFETATVSFVSILDNVVLHNESYSISNVQISTFDIELESTDYTTFSTTDSAGLGNGVLDSGNLIVEINTKTLITTQNNHNFLSGQSVKIDAEIYSGIYTVESATANTFVINSPHFPDSATTGNVLQRDLTIITDVDLESDDYQGHIAVHNFSDPYYNQVYDVNYINGNLVQVADTYPKANMTLYGEFTFTLSGTPAVSPVVNELVTQANSNATGRVVSSDGETLVLNRLTGVFTFNDEDTLSAPSGMYDVYPTAVVAESVLTTVDHDAIYPNGGKIKMDNTNSVAGMVESINRRQAISNSWIRRQGSFSMNIPMLRNPAQVYGGINNTFGGNPFITDRTMNQISSKGLTVVGKIRSNPNINQAAGFINSGNVVTTPSSLSRKASQPYLLKNRALGKNIPDPWNPVAALPKYSSTSIRANNNPQSGTSFTSLYGTRVNPSGASSTIRPAILPTAAEPDRDTDPVVIKTTGLPKPGSKPAEIAPIDTNSDDSTTGVGLNLGVLEALDNKCDQEPPPPPEPPAPIPPPPPVSYIVKWEKVDFEEGETNRLFIRRENGTTAETVYISDASRNRIKFIAPADHHLDIPDPGHTIDDLDWIKDESTGATLTLADFYDPAAGLPFTFAANQTEAGPLLFKSKADNLDDMAPEGLAEVITVVMTSNQLSSIAGYNDANVTIAALSSDSTHIRDTSRPSTVCTKCKRFFTTQRNKTEGSVEVFYYELECEGDATLVFFNNGEPDKIEIHQVDSKNETLSNSNRRVWTGANTRIATDEEKNAITSSSNISRRDRRHIRDFRLTAGGFARGIGALETRLDPRAGKLVAVRVDKGDNSSSFSYIIDIPNTNGMTKEELSSSNASADTARVSPTGGSNPQTPMFTPTGGYRGTAFQRNHGVIRYGLRAPFYQNYSGWSQHPMSGFRNLPSVFRRNGPRLTSAAGLNVPIQPGQYTSSTHQRVSGGIILPHATPIPPPASLVPEPIRSVNGGNTSLNRYAAYLANGKDMLRSVPRQLTIDVPPAAQISDRVNENFVALRGNTPSENTALNSVGNYLGSNESDPNRPPDTNVRYRSNPVIMVTPKRNAGGKLIAAGPPISVPIYKPTPSFKIMADDVIGVTPGDTLHINGAPVVMPDGGFSGLIESFKCADIPGVDVSMGENKQSEYIKVASCGDTPIEIKNGCSGSGEYHEILDFHVVREFIQTTSSSTGSGTVDGDPTTETSTSSTQFTGGAGFTVGDRLRLIGGEPVPDPYGNIEEICVEIPGANYSSADNVYVTIGDGTTAGHGVKVKERETRGEHVTSVIYEIGDIVTRGGNVYKSTARQPAGVFVEANWDRLKRIPQEIQLDPGTGGIAKITLENHGVGYVRNKPPKVTVMDLGTHQPNHVPARLTAKVSELMNQVPRVAKFEVSEVNSRGSIAALRVLDRGVYRLNPSDLDRGLPLEYDYVLEGDENDGSTGNSPGSGLGQWDPLNDYAELPSPSKAVRDLVAVHEQTSPTEEYMVPDASKETMGYDPRRNAYGGGTGARLYFTAGEIPDCSERGTAREALRLPPRVEKPNYPAELADMFNGAVSDSPYNADDLAFDTVDINPDLAVFVVDTRYDGLEFDDDSPGFLEKLGIPVGDHSPDLDCIEATEETGSAEDGVIDKEEISLTCVTTMPPLPGTRLTFVRNLFQYELRTLTDDPITMPFNSQNAKILYLESQRYGRMTDIAQARQIFNHADIPATAADFDKLWLDNHNGGWAYLENGVVQRSQTNLVDPTFIGEILLYDSETGEKEHNLEIWDPFKGILPGFLDAEIHYISEEDPVVYNSQRTLFGKKNCGQVWWDTSNIRYDWYEQGPVRERWMNWGKSFPGSSVVVYEWTQSDEMPNDYRGSGTPKNSSEFVAERIRDRLTGQFRTIYYYWVQNSTEISTLAREQFNRSLSCATIGRYIADPLRAELNTISFISSGDQTDRITPASMVISNLANIIREDEQNLQINLSRNVNSNGLRHVAWKLLREGDIDSRIPEDLSLKLIDSLCEQDANGSAVPAENLSEVEKFGTSFRPKQTMFRNPVEARRTMHYVLNEIFADTRIETANPNWRNNLTTMEYVQETNWYAINRIDSTNRRIRYDSTYRPIFTVESVRSLQSLIGRNLPDGSVVMVRNQKSDRYQLHVWDSKARIFALIAIENETISISDRIFTDEINATMQFELREFLILCRDELFNNTNLWNKFFFEMIKYAYGEQQQLDWVFKTSYLYIDKEEEDLTTRREFRPDNFDTVIEYMDEVKPYSAKIREYKDGKSTPIDLISGQMLSDFDKPPYPDPETGLVRILDTNNVVDVDLLATDQNYTKWYSKVLGDISISRITNGTLENPVRVANIEITFDRVEWRLLEPDFDPSVETYAQSIASIIVYLNSNTAATIIANENLRMVHRVFAFDPETKRQFATEVNEYIEELNMEREEPIVYADFIVSRRMLETMYTAGRLARTLALLKEKVCGNFRGQVLDSGDFTSSATSGFGSGAFGASSDAFDASSRLRNIAGSFTEESELLNYDGFDNGPFQRLHGSERPEELAVLSPLENLTVNVKTSTEAYDDGSTGADATARRISRGPFGLTNPSRVANSNNLRFDVTSHASLPTLTVGLSVVIVSDNVNSVLNDTFDIIEVAGDQSTFDILVPSGYTSAATETLNFYINRQEVEFQIHQDIFGGTEYIRIRDNYTTSLSAVLEIWHTELTVVDASILPSARPNEPGIIWIDNERIEYTSVRGNVLSGVTRGTRGTTIQQHAIGARVVNGAETEIIENAEILTDSDSNRQNWLAVGARSLADGETRNSLMEFLQEQ